MLSLRSTLVYKPDSVSKPKISNNNKTKQAKTKSRYSNPGCACVRMRVCACVCTCRWTQSLGEGVDLLGAGVTGNFEAPDMGAGN